MIRRKRKNRRGTAVVEFAALLPFLLLLFFIGADWCRVFFVAHTVQDCARTGALAASGITYLEYDLTPADRTMRGEAAVMTDANNLHPALQPSDISVVTDDRDVIVTVTYTFEAVSSLPVIGNTVEIRRAVRMPILPSLSID